MAPQRAAESDLAPDHLEYMSSVVLTDDGGGWATVQGTLSVELNASFLRSDDGGASWRRFGPTLRRTALYGLSRSTAVADRGFAVAP